VKPAQRAAIDAKRGTWLEQTSPAVDDTCPDCGADVLSFRTELRGDGAVLLEQHDVPITADLLAHHRAGGRLIDRCWTFHGDRAGWVPTFSRRRSWRRVRAEHVCATTENKHENKKENRS